MNNPKAGGSEYLQAKVANARESLLDDLRVLNKESKEEEEQTGDEQTEIKEEKEDEKNENKKEDKK